MYSPKIINAQDRFVGTLKNWLHLQVTTGKSYLGRQGQPGLLDGVLPLLELGGGEGRVRDELQPEHPLLLAELELEAGVGARLADVVDLGRLHHVDDLAAPGPRR